MAKKTAEALERALLQRIRDQFAYNFNKWEPIYREGDIDMRYRAGNPWEDRDKRQRDDAGRPALAFDELAQYRNQAVNDIRANPVSPKFNPVGDGANDDTAQFYEGLSRETDYRSDAKSADTTAFENAIDRGYGFVRVKVEYESPTSFRQQTTIEAVPNPSAVLPDADAVRPDGKDWMNLDYIERYSREEFKRAFPNAEYHDFSREQLESVSGTWQSEDSVQVSEHWDVEMREGRLQQWQVPPSRQYPEGRIVETIVERGDRKPRGGVLIQERVTEYPVVTSCFTNGLEILEKGGKTIHEHAGDWIPFAPCYGAILWLNKGSGAQRDVMSMIRLARQPYMAYCYAVTSLIEAVGMITKNPYFAYEGMLDQAQMDAIAKSLHEPVSVLLSKPYLQNARELGLLPMLQRNPLAVDISSYVGLAEMCRRAIQAAMGWTPLPTDAQRHNQKSGIALQKIEESGQKGSFHFKDNYYSMIRRRAEICENLWDRILDTPMDVIIRDKEQLPQRWRINDPTAQGERTLKSIKGRHSVTIDVGPQYASERQAANEFVDSFITSPLMGSLDPAKRDKLIALAIKTRNIGVMGDKMADVISPEPQEGQLDPAQLQMQLQQAQQMAQAMQQRIQELESGLAAKQLDVQAKQLQVEGALAGKRMEIESRERIAGVADASKRSIADLEADQRMAAAKLDSETAILIQQMKDRIDRLEMAAQRADQMRAEDHAVEMAERGHVQNLEAQERGRETEGEGDE